MDRVLNSLLDPVIIFFVLGVTIGFLRSNLEIPRPGETGSDDRMTVQAFCCIGCQAR